MQVVYSGGSTPSPSPRLQRKAGYGRPIMPGYMTHVHPQILVQRSREKFTEGDTTLRDSIPAMSTCVATLCLLLNIILPGFGTLMAGLSVLCCSNVRPKGDSKGHCIWVNAGVALLQFLLTFLCLLGWIWSIMWGVAFLSVSKQYYYRRNDDEERRKHRDPDKSRPKKQTKCKLSHATEGSNGNNAKRHHNHHHGHHHHHHEQQHPHHYYEQHQQQVAEDENAGTSSRDTEHSTTSDAESYTVASSSPAVTTASLTTPDSKQYTLSNANGYSQVPSSYEVVEADSAHLQPIITLQQASEENQVDHMELAPPSTSNDTIMKARTRHMKILQRKMSDNDLSPFVLTHQQLEAIVIHDMPINAPGPRLSTVPDETEAGLPKS